MVGRAVERMVWSRAVRAKETENALQTLEKCQQDIYKTLAHAEEHVHKHKDELRRWERMKVILGAQTLFLCVSRAIDGRRLTLNRRRKVLLAAESRLRERSHGTSVKESPKI